MYTKNTNLISMYISCVRCCWFLCGFFLNMLLFLKYKKVRIYTVFDMVVRLKFYSSWSGDIHAFTSSITTPINSHLNFRTTQNFRPELATIYREGTPLESNLLFFRLQFIFNQGINDAGLAVVKKTSLSDYYLAKMNN